MSIQRFSHCSHWGAYTLLVEDGRVIGAEPFAGDPAPSPIIHSVRHWADPTHRIAQPMVRESWLKHRGPGPRAPGDTFVPVGWDEAAKLVAGEIDRVRTEHGNGSIFAGSYGWTSCGRFHHASSQLKRMMNLVGGYTGHVDTYSIAAGPVILRHTLGDAEACGGGANTLDSVAAHAETVIVFGALSPRTAQSEAGGIARHTLEQNLRTMVARGVRVVLVSPVRDDIPDWVPAEWWPVRPNTDTALMLGLAGEIVAAGRHDRDFLARCCSGGEELIGYLNGTQDGVVRNADWAAAICEIDAERIRELARRVVATRTMITVSWSLQRADHGEQPFWAALGLASAIGQIGLPGGGVGFGYASLGGVGAPMAVSRSPSLPQGRNPNADFIPVARISDLLLNPGQTFTYEGQTRTYPDTRLVLWAGGNPFHHHQDLNRLRRAWARPETIVVQDPVWTATARRADIVLPATSSIERNDISGNKRSDHLIAMQQAIAPLGLARNDYDIFRHIADELGVEPAFSEGRDEMAWIRLMYDLTREDAERRFKHPMPAFDAFWAEGAARVPTRSNHVFLDRFRADPAAHPLATESGRIVLYSRELEGLQLADCPPHPAWLEPAEWLGRAAPDQLHLMSRQPQGKLHSQLDDAPAAQASKRDGREQVWLHPADARRFGIADGAVVRLFNARGQCLASACVVDTVRPGVAVLPTGAWYDPADEGENPLERSGNPNVLTLDKGTSHFGQGCSAHTCLVSIETHRLQETPA
ncbi:MAG: molybdopterin-dependent oxidoreductase [Pseudomonadota bacterium]